MQLNDLQILLDTEVSSGVNEEKLIKAISSEKGVVYKFIIGIDGIWKTIQDYSKKNTCRWTPSGEGKYTIMVQGKQEKSNKPFDILTKEEFTVGNKLTLIRDVKIDKTKLVIGEKITIEVLGNFEPMLYRFWISGKQGFEPIRDYTTDNKLIYTTTNEGTQEILIECKRIESKEKFDEFTTIKFDVELQMKIEILDFKCFTEDLFVNNELVFKVDVNLQHKRSLLYKFIKINKEGRAICIQDYSSRKIVSYQEKEPGEYRLLCLVKDILSNKEYDDRAIILYNVEPYNKIEIKNIRTDLKSPQLSENIINIKAEVEGGRELVYRYLIEGSMAEDSGYIRTNEFAWKPKLDGEYKISLYVKDISSKSDFEDIASIDYIIDKRSNKPIRINDVIISNSKNILVGQSVNLKVTVSGGLDVRYEFIVYKNNKEIERIDYGVCNWADFIPEEKGEYEIEIRVKDKYSTKEYDSNTYVKLKAVSYLKAEIDYILLPYNDSRLVGDLVELEVIAQNTKNVLLRYITKIDTRVVEDTGFISSKRIQFVPKCQGKYTIEIYAKNTKCEEEYDSKKEVNFYILESSTVINTNLRYNKDKIKVNEEVTFYVESNGGKDVCYEFYIMEDGNWTRFQEYSRKNFYTFIPFLKGEYRIMVIAKSFYKKVSYEDYDEIIFEVW